MEVLFSPGSPDGNGLNFYHEHVGFGEISAPMSTVDTYRYGNAVVTLMDMDPPRRLEVPNSDYVSIRGNGLWLYDPSVAVPMISKEVLKLLE